MARKVLVIGASGLFGIPTSLQLKESGFNVRLFSRNIKKVNHFFDSSFEFVEGNVNDNNILKAAMQDCYGVHISVSGDDDLTTARNVSAMANETGIKHITYISGATVCDKNAWFPMIKKKLEAEKAIKSCGINFTIFRPTWPMEQLPRFVQKGKVTIIGEQKTKIHWFAVNDFARMIANSYKKKDAQNKTFYIHGPEEYTMKKALEIYCKTFHTEIKEINTIPVWMAKAMKLLIRKDSFNMVVDLMAYFDKAGEAGNPEEANRILGIPETTLDMWMKPKMEKKIRRVGK